MNVALLWNIFIIVTIIFVVMLYDIRVLLFILSYIMVIRLLTLDRSKVFYWYAVLALGLGQRVPFVNNVAVVRDNSD